MISHPFGKGGHMSARDFARIFVDQAFETLGQQWSQMVPAEVVQAMTPQEHSAIGAEVLHLLRMLEIRSGLVEGEDFAAMWSGGPEEFRLRNRYCHPGTAVKLVRVASVPDKYAIQLENMESGEFIQSLCNLAPMAAMEAGAGMAYSQHWLSKIGIHHHDEG